MTRIKRSGVHQVETRIGDSAVVRRDFGREVGVLYAIEHFELWRYRLVSVEIRDLPTELREYSQ